MPAEDRAATEKAVDEAFASAPSSPKPPEGLVAKVKDIALPVAAKAYLFAVKMTPAMLRVGALLSEIFDVPSDMRKLGYNPNTTSGTTNPQVLDRIRDTIAAHLGVGVGGHLVISIASNVLSRVLVWGKRKLTGQVVESTETDDDVSAWAKFISELLAHLHRELGIDAPTPDAATVEEHLRELISTRAESVLESAQERQEGEVWQGKGNRWFTKKNGRIIPTKAPTGSDQKDKKQQSEQDVRAASKHQLAQAQPVDIETLGGGAGETHRVTLAGGLEGVWKPVPADSGRQAVPGGTQHRREVAASSVAEVLGFADLVPATTFRGGAGGIEGSIQQFVPAPMATEVEWAARFDGEVDLARAAAFDYIIGHSDRHRGNWLVNTGEAGVSGSEQTPTGKLVLIDNGYAFPTHQASDNYTNPDLIYRAIQLDLKVPDLSHLERKEDEIAQALSAAGIEQAAIDLTLKRFDAIRRASGAYFGDVPASEQESLRAHLNVPNLSSSTNWNLPA